MSKTPISLRSPVSALTGVGPAVAKKLEQRGITYVFQLLFHFPTKYVDYSQVLPIAQAPLQEPVSIRGEITTLATRRSWKRRGLTVTSAEVEDDSGTVKLLWFNRSYIGKKFAIGDSVYVAGKIAQKNNELQMANPDIEAAGADTTNTAKLVPVYPSTKGISQKQWRLYMRQAVDALLKEPDELPEWLPQEIRELYEIPSLAEALPALHFPQSPEHGSTAKQRFGFDEILLGQLFVQSSKHELAANTAPQIQWNEELYQARLRALPYELTNAQYTAIEQCMHSLTKHVPMNTLVEGDVGAGKTVVAALLMDQVVEAGYQCALMAPTELLAQQHASSLQALLTDRNIVLHTSNSPGDTQSGDIIIGTHALIQEQVQFTKLGLAVIDEQHRFGVQQRKTMAEHAHTTDNSYSMPHLLSMTATPIPRSLALTIYGDLDLSIIDEKPANRKEIITSVHTPKQREDVVRALAEHIARSEQIYIVCPRIASDGDVDVDISAELDMPNVEDMYQLYSTALPEARLEMLHGKLSADEKEEIMRDFSDGNIDVLISTTVIEVGVDVPNATAIVIEGADRFGLAQLHQLRGRVGRSDVQSYCYVVDNAKEPTERLTVFADTTNGFELAEYDLATRGPGSVFGGSQSGFMNQFKMVDFHDVDFIETAKKAAEDLYPELPNLPALQKRFEAFAERVHLE